MMMFITITASEDGSLRNKLFREVPAIERKRKMGGGVTSLDPMEHPDPGASRSLEVH